MERWAPGIPHYAVVQTEDVGLFKRVEPQENLKILTTQQVLPTHIENARRWRTRGKPLDQKYLQTRKLRKVATGWRCQQFTKLLAHEFLEERIIVCIDSDVLLSDHFDVSDFQTDGRTHLFSCVDPDAEMASWLIDTLNYFSLSLQGKPINRYIHAPVPLDRNILQDIAHHLSHGRRVTDKHWLDVLVRSNLQSEYTIYGVFSDYLECSGYWVLNTGPNCTTNIWWHDDIDLAQVDVSTLERRRYLLIQSNLNLPSEVVEVYFEWAMKEGFYDLLFDYQ